MLYLLYNDIEIDKSQAESLHLGHFRHGAACWAFLPGLMYLHINCQE